MKAYELDPRIEQNTTHPLSGFSYDEAYLDMGEVDCAPGHHVLMLLSMTGNQLMPGMYELWRFRETDRA